MNCHSGEHSGKDFAMSDAWTHKMVVSEEEDGH